MWIVKAGINRQYDNKYIYGNIMCKIIINKTNFEAFT